ncbi:fructosamine kinase family protein [Microbacterium sp. LRZ72]|uniref:fructosamine kinase family protein n=1 Tax=Microbacterium sp. LRZ72 TaxID=2942481 RepID=UPI0029B9C45E|nr:fructosamine kinase family protein [Microbacterium sp. LRZ72]MDX2377430.1 fructosamine kinase family protein [Microbacterium sp. LRZ72]
MTPPPDVVKTRADAPTGFFEAEAEGLAWLAEAEPRGGVRCARVRAVSPGRIVLERVASRHPDGETAVRFGRSLARTHDAGAAAFGAPPPGHRGDIFIGRLPQPTCAEASWGRFYAAARVRPFLDAARGAGNLETPDWRSAHAACERIEAGEFDDGDAPARLHGDLWSGNVLWSTEGVVLIDPAAHGGHRETDLAMLALFGCPFLERIVEGYEREHPLRDGWPERIPLHQLHPLAVHAVGHGPAYGAALGSAARAVLALADC